MARKIESSKEKPILIDSEEEDGEVSDNEYFVNDTSAVEHDIDNLECHKNKLNFRNVMTPSGTVVKREKVNGPTCFNCEGSHRIVECPFPKDEAKVRKNAQENRKNRGPGNGARYHADELVKNNYKPGVLSDELRTALGLGERELPVWIYRMRTKGVVKGYPPELLIESFSNTDQLLDFHATDDINNVEVTSPSKNQIRRDENEIPPTIEGEKIHSYLGYNKYSIKMIDNSLEKYEVPALDEFVDKLETFVEKQFCEHHNVKDYVVKKRKANMADKAVKKSQDREAMLLDKSNDEGPADFDNSFKDDNVSRVTIDSSISTFIIDEEEHFKNAEDNKPALNKFQEGIQPFEAREESVQQGFFSRIMKSIRKKK
uniref:PSP domain-containing protein n=1 Tax=Rhabditophanes sp. KR3021 TaxID=114890 RepID=A0AC35TS91_9BILA